MSGNGTPELDAAELRALGDFAARRRPRVAIVASRWHTEVMDGLIGGAYRFLAHIEAADSCEVLEVRAPGSFELPVLAGHMAQQADIVIALGVVVRGGTPHFDYVCDAATQGLSRVSLESGIPIGFGLLTCDDDAQARDRAGLEGSGEDKGFEAAHAAFATAEIMDAFPLPA